MAANVKQIDEAADLSRYMRGLGERARVAARELARSGTAARNRALTASAEAIRPAARSCSRPTGGTSARGGTSNPRSRTAWSSPKPGSRRWPSASRRSRRSPTPSGR